MIARASQLFLPTLRDAPADAEAVSHKLLVRGGFIRQVSAGLWTFPPLGWRVHRKVEQIIREEMDAIGAQELLAPVLTPVELWEATGRDKIPEIFHAPGSRGRGVHPAAHARGDVHVPRARAPELQAAAAALVPLPDQGSRRAAPARRPAPRPRVHHEGLVLVRPRRGRRDAQLRARTRAAYHRIFERCGVEAYERAGGVGDDGRRASRRLPRAVGLGREHARHAARTATTPPTSRSRAASRARRSSRRALDAPEEVETPGVTTCEALAAFLGIDLAATSKAMPVTNEDGTVVLALVRGDDRRRAGEARCGACEGASRPSTDDEIRAAFGAVGRLARPGRLRRRGRRRRDAARRPVRRRREPRRLASARRRGRPRLRAALRRPARAASRATAAPMRRRAALRDRDRGRPHLQARHALLGAARRDLPRRGRPGEAARRWAATGSAPGA